MIFTIDDQTLRATQVQWLVASTAIRILIFDNSGNLVLTINSGQDVSPKAVDLEVRLVQVTKSDTTVKSYISPRFTVYFNGVS